MSGYTKLHSSIVHSTVWREPNHVRIVWITILALADRDGRVEASIPGLADAARVTIQQCEEALQTLMAPDPYSRTPDHEGRRIEPVDGGWALLNYETYRQKMSAEDRREKARIRQQKKRAKDRSQVSRPVTPCSRSNDIAEAEAEAEAEQEHHQSSGQARLPIAEAAQKPQDPVRDLWDWYEQQCVERKLARKSRKLSDSRRRNVQALLKHIRQTLGTDLAGAIASQRAHLAYRLAQADEYTSQRAYMHTDTPWRHQAKAGRTTWWDWWHDHVDDAPEQAANGPAIETREEAEAWAAEHGGQAPPGWRWNPDFELEPQEAAP